MLCSFEEHEKSLITPKTRSLSLPEKHIKQIQRTQKYQANKYINNISETVTIKISYKVYQYAYYAVKHDTMKISTLMLMAYYL